MPGGDGTGPRGFGPMTGRAAGFCAGFGIPGYADVITGRGYRFSGRGRCGGRGFRNLFYETGLTGWQRAVGYMPGRGNPFVYGRPYNASMTANEDRQREVDALRARAEYLEDALDGIRAQLKELEEQRADSKTG